MNYAIPFIAILLTQPIAPLSRVTESKEIESARQFVQGFYTWYTPLAHRLDNNGPAMDKALKRRPSYFSPELLRALRADSAAQAKVKDEIVGLDGDPFLNCQDPADHYSVQKVFRKGETYFANVHSINSGKLSSNPDVIAKLEKRRGHWRFANFLDATGWNLLENLKLLRKVRQSHR
jgi:hypothetical protein